ncbi:SCO family protein [Nocardioides korecus]
MAADRSRRRLAALAATLPLLLAPALAGCGSDAGDSASQSGAPVKDLRVPDDDGYKGIKLDTAYRVPSVPLTDTAGKPYDLSKQQKRTIVFFGYTKCPDICQIVMSTIASAVARLDQADRARVQVLFVTTDPARDTEKVLRTYLDRYDPSFQGVTGPLARIEALGKPMGIEVAKGQKLPSGGYEVDHTTNVISVRDAVGDLVWTASTSPSDLASDLHKVLGADR